jgi:hypothetical protein
MKKIFTLILATTISTNIFAQLKASLKFSPTLAMNLITDNSGIKDNESYDDNGLGLRYSTGINLDFHFNNTVAFGTGLWFSVRKVGITTTNDLVPSPNNKTDEVYNLQYLQIPLTLKMFTNEIADDMRLYFQVGPSVDFKINEKLLKGNELDKPVYAAAFNDGKRAVFSYIDLSIIGGAGVEYQMGEHTALFVGLSYNRGLLNTLNPLLKWGDGSYVNADINNKTSAISLDLGIKF